MPAHEVEHFPSPKTRSRIPRMITSESDSDARFVYERQGVGEIRRGSIMFAMSACHGTRRQVVDQSRPHETGASWEQAVSRAFLRPGGLASPNRTVGASVWLSADGHGFREPSRREGILTMSPQRLLQIALALFGAVFLLVYPLAIVWPSGWAWHAGAPHDSQYFMMIVGIYATLGVFLL